MTSTWTYYGGFHVFTNSTETPTVNPASTWFFYGGFHTFSHSLFLPTSSSSAAPVITASTARVRGYSVSAFEVMAHRSRRRSGRYVI